MPALTFDLCVDADTDGFVIPSLGLGDPDQSQADVVLKEEAAKPPSPKVLTISMSFQRFVGLILDWFDVLYHEIMVRLPCCILNSFFHFSRLKRKRTSI